ncbi:MAG: peptidylprolyl isomerase [Sedimentisphaerales bacterium]|jgi:tetratricopeptide (TPR) repeat protein|nr:peptidylprolyl isomerase [Sedimentisphaerales bacterium]
MDKKLDLTLPTTTKPSRSRPVHYAILIVLLVTCLVNTALLLTKRSSSSPSRAGLEAQQLKDLATRLHQRNLYEQAARAWQEYLEVPGLPAAERSRALFQQGLCLEKAGRFADAADAFYRSEITAKVDELSGQIQTHLKDCLEQLGKFSALRYELMARTSYKSQDDTSGTVVAQIGPERITEADLAAAIESAVDMQLAPVATYMTAEQLNAERQRLLNQYKSSSSRLDFLRSWMARELLYREALERGLPQQAKTKGLLEQLTRRVIADRMMDEVLASRIHMTESDLQTYYQANKHLYTEPNEDPNNPPRIKAFAEVRDQVLADLARRKRQEIESSYLQELMDRYHAVIHTSAFGEPNQAR